VFGVRLTGVLAWWIRRTYYLFQMPRWDRRLRIVLDWTVAVFFRPDITKVELRVEREQVRGPREMATAAVNALDMTGTNNAQTPGQRVAASSVLDRSARRD